MTMKFEDKTLAQHASAANAIAVDAKRLANWRKRLSKSLGKAFGGLSSMFTFDADLLVPPKKGEDKPLVLVYIGSEDLTLEKIIVKINKAFGLFLNPCESLPPTIEVKLGTVEFLVSFKGLPVAEAA